jgi:hypothetical protein
LGGLKGGAKEEKHHCILKGSDMCKEEEGGEIILILCPLGNVGGETKEEEITAP